MRRRLATVRIRTTLGTSIFVGLALLALGIILSIVIRHTMTEQVDETLSIRAAEVANSIEANNDPGGVSLRDGEDSFTQVVAATGEVLSSSPSLIGAPMLSNEPAGSFTDLPGPISDWNTYEFTFVTGRRTCRSSWPQPSKVSTMLSAWSRQACGWAYRCS